MPKPIQISLVSSAGTPYVVQFTVQDDWINYFATVPEKQLAILQALVNQVINKSYIDIDIRTTIQTILVHHENHDASHALRGWQLVIFLAELIKLFGTTEAQHALTQLSQEEWHLTLLAGFLYRAGRTNEQSSISGGSHTARSAQIFSAIALALGYSSELVAAISSCIEHYAPVNDTKRLNQIPIDNIARMTREKIKLINGLLLISHNSDLVRCWSDFQSIEVNNLDNLAAFFPAKVISNIEYSLVHFAKALCVWTGTKYYNHETGQLQPAPQIYKAQCVVNLVGVAHRLQFVMNEWLSVGVDLDKMNLLFNNVQQFIFPEAYQEQRRAEYTKSALEALHVYTSMTGINPTEQSHLSIANLRQKLKSNDRITPFEMAEQNEMGLTHHELHAYNYLYSVFPWTLKHVTKYFDAIIKSGFIYSTAELQKAGFQHSHTTMTEATQHFVFTTIGSQQSTGFTESVPHLRTFSTPYRTLIADNPYIINTSRFTVHLDKQTKKFSLLKHEIKIVYDVIDPSNVHSASFKTYVVTRPNGQRGDLKLDFINTLACGADIMAHNSLLSIYLLRFFDADARQLILSMPHGPLMRDLIDFISGIDNNELLIPKQLNIFDHHVELSTSQQEHQQYQLQLQQIKDALRAIEDEPLQKLLSNGFPPDFLMENGATPLALMLQDSGWNHYLSKMILLIHSGASFTRMFNNEMLFDIAVKTKNTLLVAEMLERNDGHVFHIQSAYEAIKIALRANDVAMLALFELHGLNYSGLDYVMIFHAIDVPELAFLAMIKRFKAHQFDFNKKTTRHYDAAVAIIEHCLRENKVRVLQQLLPLGLFKSALQSKHFKKSSQDRLQVLGLLTPNEIAAPVSSKTHNVQVFLVTEDQEFLLIRAHYNKQLVPYWHGITGTITTEINEASLTQFCLEQINWRPAIQKFKVHSGNEHSCEDIILVHLKPNVQPLVFFTPQVATGTCQKVELWLQEKITDLAKTVITHEKIAVSIQRQDQFINNNDFAMLNTHVYHPNQSILLNLLDTPHPNLQKLEQLISLGYPINMTTQYRELEISLLMLTVLHRSMPAFNKLLECGADIYQRTGGRMELTIVHYAIIQENLAVLKSLRDHGCDFKHIAFAGLVDFVKMRRENLLIKQFLIEIDAIPAEDNVVIETKLNKGTRLLFNDLHTWLVYSRLDKKQDIEQRIQSEYQISVSSGINKPLLQLLETDLKKQNLLPANVSLAIADVGFHPVFECIGLQQPVIAISRLFLELPNVQLIDVVIGICMSVAALQIRNKQASIFLEISQEDQARIDRNVIRKLAFSFEQVKHYLQLAATLYENTKDKTYFKWPRELTNAISSILQKSPYDDRIKLLLKDMNQNLFDAKNNIDYVFPIVFSEFQKECASVPRINLFPDFPKQASPPTLLAWFIDHIELLFEDLLAWEYALSPSIQIKQYSQLLFDNLEKLGVDNVDKILRVAADRRVPAYAFLHAYLNKVREFNNYKCNEHAYGGYFKDMWQATQLFCNAKDFESAIQHANSVIKLYKIIYPALVMWAYESRALDKGFAEDQPPQREWYLQHACNFLPYDFQETITQSFDAWIFQEYKESKQLGVIWRARWVLGLWKGTQCELLPATLWENSQYQDYEKCTDPNALSVTPRAYAYHVRSDYVNHLNNWREKNNRYPTIAPNATATEIKQFLKINKKSLMVIKHNHSFNTPMELSIFRALKQLEQSPQGKSSLRAILFEDWWRDNFDSMDFFTECVYRSSAFTQAEKFNFWMKFNIRITSSFDRLFTGKEDFIRDVLPLAQSIYTGARDFFRFFDSKIKFYSLFDPELLLILDYLQTYFMTVHSAHEYWMKKVTWQPPKLSKLSPIDFIRLYRLLDSSHSFEKWDLYIEFRQEVLAQLNKIIHFDEFRTAAFLLLTMSVDYTPLRISDEVLIHNSLNLFAERFLQVSGCDDGTSQFSATINWFLSDCFGKLPRNDYDYLADKIMHGILAQPALCHWYTRYFPSADLPAEYLITLLEVMNIIGEEQKDKYDFVNFLADDIQKQNLIAVVHRIKNNDRLNKHAKKFFNFKHDLTDQQYLFWLRILNQLFWTLSIEQRAFVTDALICPSSLERSEQDKLICYQQNLGFIIQKLLGNNLTSDRDKLSSILIQAFLAATLPHERQFLLAALLCAAKNTGENNSFGEKLVVLFENMGPAFIKLGQAIHSHPDTPEDIRKDLANMKSDVAVPTRWDLLSYIEKTLPAAIFQNIAKVDEILGSASFHIAVKIIMHDGSKQVLLLTRADAESLAAKGFAHLKRTAQQFNDPQFNHFKATGQDLISHAEEMSQNELNYQVGDQQHILAATIYNRPAFEIQYANQRYQIQMRACQSFASGPGFRLLELIPGVSFNKLPGNSPTEKAIRKVVALAMMKFELTLILSGHTFDCDRHGEQIKIVVQQNTIQIGLFDFGELSIAPITNNQQAAICRFLAELPKANNMFELMQQHIQQTSDAEVRKHLMRTQKAVLALSDYLRELEPEIPFKLLIKEILPKIDPEYRTALIDGYRPTTIGGWFQFFANTVGEAIEEQLRSVFKPL